MLSHLPKGSFEIKCEPPPVQKKKMPEQHTSCNDGAILNSRTQHTVQGSHPKCNHLLKPARMHFSHLD